MGVGFVYMWLEKQYHFYKDVKIGAFWSPRLKGFLSCASLARDLKTNVKRVSKLRIQNTSDILIFKPARRVRPHILCDFILFENGRQNKEYFTHVGFCYCLALTLEKTSKVLPMLA